jgi:four helix bundle protein
MVGPQHRRELIEQLDRASLSVLLNTAEGNGKRQGQQRAKFFDDARGSAFECAACLDASVAKGFASIDRVRGKEMLARVVAMLSRLIDRFDTKVSLYGGPTLPSAGWRRRVSCRSRLSCRMDALFKRHRVRRGTVGCS